MVIEDSQPTHAMLRVLKALGVQLAIDDFGTGQSWLFYFMKRYAVDHVKIDRSFIEHIDENKVETRIVSGIIDLCHALGIKVIAEGIESARQFAALRDLGADFGQRYYFTELLAPGETGGIDVTSFGCERS